MRFRARLLSAGLLAGCAAAPAPVPDAAPPVPTATGIEIPGTGREIGFGRTLASAEASLTRLYGAPARRACPGGTVLVSEGIELHFAGFGFSGWRAAAGSAGRLC
ncbi:MAG: hypothetical protein ACU0BS_04480 [Hasllibacter sp.]